MVVFVPHVGTSSCGCGDGRSRGGDRRADFRPDAKDPGPGAGISWRKEHDCFREIVVGVIVRGWMSATKCRGRVVVRKGS